MITFVHALWGDECVSTWPKILRDIQWGWSWRSLPSRYKHLVFAYGLQNARYLKQWGIRPIRLSRQAVVDFRGTGDRELDGRGSRGTFNYGVSMWEHKRHAMHAAFEHGADEIIWLDWDTRCIEKTESRLCDFVDGLSDGSPFQGRLRSYKNIKSGGGLFHIYHGGCYYIREPAILEELARLREFSPYVTDEALITFAIHNLYFDGRKVTPSEHRKHGFDNQQLYTTRMNSVDGSMHAMWREGDMDRSQQFHEARWKNPEDQFKFYKPEEDEHQVSNRMV